MITILGFSFRDAEEGAREKPTDRHVKKQINRVLSNIDGFMVAILGCRYLVVVGDEPSRIMLILPGFLNTFL